MSATWNSGRLRIISTTRSPRADAEAGAARPPAGRPGRRTRRTSARPSRRRPSTAAPRRRACGRTVSRNRFGTVWPRTVSARVSFVHCAMAPPRSRRPPYVTRMRTPRAPGCPPCRGTMSTAFSTGRLEKLGRVVDTGAKTRPEEIVGAPRRGLLYSHTPRGVSRPDAAADGSVVAGVELGEDLVGVGAERVGRRGAPRPGVADEPGDEPRHQHAVDLDDRAPRARTCGSASRSAIV